MADTQLERSLRAWERFFATGAVEAGDVRDEILRSWKRCHEAGLNPLAPVVPVKQNREEWSETLKRNGSYIEAALPFMRFLGSAVRGTGFILVLTDAAGIVLETFGDEEIVSRARENNFVPGSCRSEEVVKRLSAHVRLDWPSLKENQFS